MSALECLLPGTRGHMWLCLIYVLSYLALNDPVIRGPRLLGHLPGTGEHRVWLLGAQAHADPGHKEVLGRANRWRNPAHP
jgi:hypothetical protein